MKKYNNTYLSIIVPVYNAERYLCQCLDSILNQSFKDFELLLIDDGSTDKSGAICDEYARKEERVRVFHQQNQGVSVARNVGLKNAQGEWIYFPDSDDIIVENAFEIMIKKIAEDIDYVICGYEVYDEDGSCTYSIPERKESVITKDEALMEMFDSTDYRYNGYLWNKLFKASIIKENNLSFVRGIKFNEDRLFNVSYLCHIKGKVAYTTTPIYKYIERTTSAMASLTQRFNPDFITDLDAFVNMRREISNADVSQILLNAHAAAMYYSVNRYYSMCRQYKELTGSRIKAVETRFLEGVGFCKWVHLRFEKMKRKIKKVCKNS